MPLVVGFVPNVSHTYRFFHRSAIQTPSSLSRSVQSMAFRTREAGARCLKTFMFWPMGEWTSKVRRRIWASQFIRLQYVGSAGELLDSNPYREILLVSPDNNGSQHDGQGQ